MEFFQSLLPFAGTMFNNIVEEASSSASAYNASLQYGLGTQSLEQARQLNLQNIQNTQELALNGQNFTAQQNQLNRDMSNSQFTQGIQSAQNLQQSRFNSLNTLQDSRLSAFQNMQTNNNITNFARGALNFGGGLLSSGLQFAANNQIASLQRQNFDYMTDKASDAYTASGLPSWLAYSQNPAMMNALPRTAQVFSGQNMMQSSLPGNPMSQAWTGSESQSAFGMGNVPLAQ